VTEEERCDATDLFPSQCGHCRKTPDTAVEFEHVAVRTVEAKFASKCPGCGEPIEVGETVGLADAEARVWVCGGCIR